MRAFWLTMAGLMLISGPAIGAEYHVDRNQENVVRFISDAPLEDFDGVTDHIDGYVFWEGDNIPSDAAGLESSQLHLEVRLESLDTGIGLRNRHMREDYLETDKFPYAIYTARLTEVKRLSDTLLTATAEGKIRIHGEEKPLQVTASLVPEANGYRVRCNFEVNLKDFKIKIPKFMFLKIGEIIRLELDFQMARFTD